MFVLCCFDRAKASVEPLVSISPLSVQALRLAAWVYELTLVLRVLSLSLLQSGSLLRFVPLWLWHWAVWSQWTLRLRALAWPSGLQWRWLFR
mgnify:CR=1 FL=1